MILESQRDKVISNDDSRTLLYCFDFRYPECTWAARAGQLGRPCANSHGAGNGNVPKLTRFTRASQQHSTAAHVAATHKFRRKQQPLSKYTKQRLDIFLRGYAAEKDGLAMAAYACAQRSCVALKRLAIWRVVFVHRTCDDFAQFSQSENPVGRDQPAGRCDDENTLGAGWRVGIGTRIR